MLKLLFLLCFVHMVVAADPTLAPLSPNDLQRLKDEVKEIDPFKAWIQNKINAKTEELLRKQAAQLAAGNLKPSDFGTDVTPSDVNAPVKQQLSWEEAAKAVSKPAPVQFEKISISIVVENKEKTTPGPQEVPVTAATEPSTKGVEDTKNVETSTEAKQDETEHKEDDKEHKEDETEHKEDDKEHKEDDKEHKEDDKEHKEDDKEHKEPEPTTPPAEVEEVVTPAKQDEPVTTDKPAETSTPEKEKEVETKPVESEEPEGDESDVEIDNKKHLKKTDFSAKAEKAEAVPKAANKKNEEVIGEDDK